MSVHRIPLIKESWNIYIIACECGEREFVVKIGVSSTPFERYAQLLPGIPFESIMMYSLVGWKKKTYKLESTLHKLFADHHTRGEWFKFSISDKEEFHKTLKAAYFAATKQELTWERILPEQVSRHVVALNCLKTKKRALTERQKEFNAYRKA